MIDAIGCIGLGVMGKPIALHLLARGYRVSGYARRPDFFARDGKELINAGMEVAESPARLASGCDLVITNVLTGEDVHEVLLGREDSVAEGAQAGLLVMDHSTIAPSMAEELGKALSARGIAFVDAPVSGGGAGAEAGTLVAMLGGGDEAVASVSPVLDCYTSGHRHIGGVGHGQVAKLCNQIAQVVAIQGVAEAMRFAARHEADQSAILDVMEQGFASSKMLSLMAPKMIEGDYSPGMESRLHAKDMATVRSAAVAAGFDLPAADLVLGQLDLAQRLGMGRQDTSSLYRLLDGKTFKKNK